MTAEEINNGIEALPVEDRIAVANRRLRDIREGRVESVSLEDVKNSVVRPFSS